MNTREYTRARIDNLAKEFHLTWFPWQKKVELVYEIHTLFQELDVSWTQKDTAEFLDYSFEHTNESCRLGQALKDPLCAAIKDMSRRKDAITYVRKVRKWKRLA